MPGPTPVEGERGIPSSPTKSSDSSSTTSNADDGKRRRIDGGLRPNVVAPAAKAVADVRVASPAEADRIEAIRALEPVSDATSLEIEGGFVALRSRTRRETGHCGSVLGPSPTGSESRFRKRPWRRLRRHFTSMHTATLDGLGAVGDGAHAHREHVLVDRPGARRPRDARERTA